MILDNVNCIKFFPAYAPRVANWSHKKRGLSGKNQPVTFTAQDWEDIANGFKQLERAALARAAKSPVHISRSVPKKTLKKGA